MKYISNFKIFESENTVEESIELCKDYIETFNDSDDKFKIFGYKLGYTNNERRSEFTPRPSHESDDVAILFYLGPKNDDDDNNFVKIKSIEDIDTTIAVLNKSKSVFKRLSIYSKYIELSLDNGVSRFILAFENTNEEEKTRRKIKRIDKQVSDSLRDYETSKTIHLLNRSNYTIEGDYENLYKLLTKDISRFPGWKPGDRTQFSIRYQVSSTITDDNKIVLKIGQVKWKNRWGNEGYKPFKATEEEINEIADIAVNKICGTYHISSEDRRLITYEVNKNTIVISLK